MIVEEDIEIKWSARTREHYIKLGYTYTKCGDTLVVKSTELHEGSAYKVSVKCCYCGKVKKIAAYCYYAVMFTKGRYCCVNCLHVEKTNSISEVKALFVSKGYTPLFTEYKNNKTKLPYLCDKHPEKVQYTRYDRLLQGHGCMLCGYETVSSKRYKGGLTVIASYLRNVIVDWKKRSMLNSDYLCEITNNRFEKIHHLYPFREIVREAHDNLNIEERSVLKDYSSEELAALKKEVIRLHDEAPLGACITEELHRLFHKIYGTVNFTPEDYYQFKYDYTSGVYDE